MATLKGKTISETYPLLLKITSSGVDGTLRNVEDGDGTTSALQISTGAINVSGTITASGNVDFNGDLDVDGTTNLDVVDIDGAVDMASTLAVADDITLANNKYYEVKDSGGSAIRLLGLDNSNNIYMGFVDDATGTGSLYLRTGGTNALTIDNSQNATFAGDVKLLGASSYARDLTFAHGATNYYWRMGYTDASNGNTLAFINRDGGSEQEVMRMDYNKRVGIGTTSPASLLHIESDSADPTLRITNKTAAAINTGPDIEFWNNPFTGSTTNSYESGAIRVRKTSGSDNNHDHYMSFETRKNSPEGINEHMRITSAGNVGINETNPSGKLEIVGASDDQLFLDSNSATANTGIFFKENGQDKWEVYHRGATEDFRIYNYVNNSFDFVITSDGVVSTSGDFQPGADIQLQNGRGISFSNMPNNANMTSELFDDYEEGTISTSVNGITASTNDGSGTYTKIGRLVHLEVRVTISGKSGGTGNPYILLPFNASGAGIGASIVGAQISKNTIITGGSPAYLGLYGSTNQIYANDVSGNYIGDGDWGNGVMGFNLVYNT